MANINYDEVKERFKTQLESSEVPYRASLALLARGLNLVYPLVDLEWKKGKKLYKNMMIDTIKYIEARRNKSSNYDAMKSIVCGESLPLVWKNADESGAKISAFIAATTKSAYDVSQLSLKSISITKIRTQVAEIYVAYFQAVHAFGMEYDPQLQTYETKITNLFKQLTNSLTKLCQESSLNLWDNDTGIPQSFFDL